jgi:hypothetical protein
MQKQSYGFLSDFRGVYPMHLTILVAVLVTIACFGQEPADLLVTLWRYAVKPGSPSQESWSVAERINPA